MSMGLRGKAEWKQKVINKYIRTSQEFCCGFPARGWWEMSNIRGMIFCEAAVLGVLLMGLHLTLPSWVKYHPQTQRYDCYQVLRSKWKTLWLFRCCGVRVDSHSEAQISYVPDLMFFTWVSSALWFIVNLQGIPKQTLVSKRLHRGNSQCLVSLKIHMHLLENEWEIEHICECLLHEI